MLADVHHLAQDAAKLAVSPLWPLADDEVTASLHAAFRAEQAVLALQTRLLQHAGTRGLPTARGHRTTAAWLRTEFRLDPAPARDLADRAAVLSRHSAVEQAWLDGHTDARQAAVIAATLDTVAAVLSELAAAPHPAAAGAVAAAGAGARSAAAAGADALSGVADPADADAAGADAGADAAGAAARSADAALSAAAGAAALSAAAGAGAAAGVADCPGAGRDAAAGVVAAPAMADAAEALDPPAAARILHEAEATMIDMAARLSAHQLRRVGDRILTHVAPHLADRADEQALAREEARAHHSRGFTLSTPVNGLVRLSGYLGTEDAALVQAALHPLCTPAPAHSATLFASGSAAVPAAGSVAPAAGSAAPTARSVAPTAAGVVAPTARSVAPTAAGVVAPTAAWVADAAGFVAADRAAADARDLRSPAQRRADALVDICRLALRTGELPESGGEPAQLAVTVAYEPLTRALGVATTDAGQRLSATTVRRLACDARILPAVLGGAGQVLDLGRTRRLANATLRRALSLRDRGCAFPDCDLPPRWTDAHHLTAWTAGGPTSLDNLVLLCRRHHRAAHDPTAGWHIRLGADRHPDFVPPPDIDPAQHPRRNLYHPRQ